MVFREAMGLFLEYLSKADRSPETIKLYREYLGRFDDYMTEKLNRPAYLDDVKPDDLERYLFEPPNDVNISQGTRNIITTAFKSFYTFCHMKGYCDTNIGIQITQIRVKPKERAYITEEELLLIAEQIINPTYKALMLTMFYTGMRISEAVDLTFEDFHFEEGYIFIRKPKSRFDRSIPISIKLRVILEEYLDYRDRLDTDSDRVFAIEAKGRCSISYFNLMLKTASEKAGIKADIHSHILRHSFASNLIAKGVDIVKIKNLLGHKKLETTQIYLHANMYLLKCEIDRL